MARWTKLVGMMLGAASLAGTAHAEDVTLGFGSLPSAQGWTYLSAGGGAGIPDTNLFTATGSSLDQNTMGISLATAGGNYFQRNVALQPSGDFSLRVVASVSRFEGQALGGGTTYPYGLSFGVSTPDGYYAYGVSGTRFSYVGPGVTPIYVDFPTGFDLGADNEFLLTRTGTNTVFSINGAAVLTNATYYNEGTSYLYVGDGTGFGNAAGRFSAFEFRSTAVPEPATWAMMIVGGGLVGGALRRPRRRLALG